MTDAERIISALGGHWHGQSGSAPCPVCQPDGRRDQNALSLRDRPGGGLLLHCHKAGCAYRDVLAAAGTAPGTYEHPDPAEAARRRAEERAETERKSAQAKRCWDETQPIAGSLAERYLRRRRIACPLPNTLRFHPECWHGPTARHLAAMVARVEGADGFAIHRTFLAPDGTKAVVEPAKMMLGACAGGAVRLLGGHPRLVVAEGIETALSLASGLLDGPMSLWAALSASGMAALRLPPLVSGAELVVASDSDDSGAGRGAAHELAERAHALGWPVSLLPAPDGQDWNDVLLGRVAA